MRAYLVVLLLVICAVGVFNSTGNKAPAEQQTTNANGNERPSVAPHESATSATPKSEQGQQHFGQRFWDFTLTDTIIAAFTIVLSVVGYRQWIVLKRTVDATNALVEATKKEFVANHRPWVSVRYEPISDVTYDRHGTFKIDVAFTLKNHGKTPALNVFIAAGVFPISGDSRIKQQELSSKAKERPSTPDGMGMVLFPGEPWVENRPYDIPKADIMKFIQEAREGAIVDESNPEWSTISPLLVGCVDYCFSFEEGHHQTGFIARLMHKTSPTQKRNKFFVKDNPSVPMAELSLEPWVLGHTAD